MTLIMARCVHFPVVKNKVYQLHLCKIFHRLWQWHPIHKSCMHAYLTIVDCKAINIGYTVLLHAGSIFYICICVTVSVEREEKYITSCAIMQRTRMLFHFWRFTAVHESCMCYINSFIMYVANIGACKPSMIPWVYMTDTKVPLKSWCSTKWLCVHACMHMYTTAWVKLISMHTLSQA